MVWMGIEKECRVDKKNREQSRMGGEHQDFEGGNKEGNREAVMLGDERKRKQWEEGKIEAILDTRYRGNVWIEINSCNRVES